MPDDVAHLWSMNLVLVAVFLRARLGAASAAESPDAEGGGKSDEPVVAG